MDRHLGRNQSTVQFDRNHGGWCIWGLLPFHFHSFNKLMPRTRHKHEGHSKYGPKTSPRESDNGEEYEAGNPNRGCNAVVCIRKKIPPSHYSEEGSLHGGKVIAQPRLKRTCAVHYSERSSKYHDDLNIDLNHSVMEEREWETRRLAEQDVPDHDDFDSSDEFSSKTFDNFFDAFMIDRKLFMKNKRKSDAGECERVVESRKKVTMRRSGSYPTANKSCSRYADLTTSKLEDKLIEVWPSGSSTASPFSSTSPSSSTSSSSSSHQPDDIKLTRSRSMLSKLPMDGGGEGSLRRASSLNESLERYTQLLDTRFTRDSKLSPSNSLRLSSEDGVYDHNPYDSTMLGKVRSMHEALQVDSSDRIEFPEVLTKSGTQRTRSYFPQRSDSGVIEDEPGTTDMQNALDMNLEDILQVNALRRKEIIDLTDLPKALKQPVDLATTQNPTGFHEGLKDQLLSDLVNELLYDAYEECDAYYWPTSLCSNCRLYPQSPTEDEVTRKVLSRIQKIQGFILEASNTVKSITAYDLANRDGWMNLQVDAESLGLALEEMFFDELVQELIYE